VLGPYRLTVFALGSLYDSQIKANRGEGGAIPGLQAASSPPELRLTGGYGYQWLVWSYLRRPTQLLPSTRRGESRLAIKQKSVKIAH